MGTRGLQPMHVLDSWLDAGVTLVQLRAKSLSFGPFLQLAESMALACRRAGAVFIVNDRADVARLADASGVHVGQEDLTPADVRLLLPGAAWIGLSTHTDAQVVAGLESAATYLATGPVFATGTKAHTDPVIGFEGVRRAAGLVEGTGRPLVAIGGIALETAPAVIAAGAQSVAIISDLLEGGDPGARARAYLHALA